MIELLIVIAIIGILSSVIMVSLNGGRIKARDAKRIDALRNIASMLDVYFQEQGHYPVRASWVGDCANPSGTNWIPDSGSYTWSDAFISQVPRDPARACPSVYPYNASDDRASTKYAYKSTDAAGSGYELMARLEDPNNPKTIKNDKTRDCAGAEYFATDGYHERTYAINSC